MGNEGSNNTGNWMERFYDPIKRAQEAARIVCRAIGNDRGLFDTLSHPEIHYTEFMSYLDNTRNREAIVISWNDSKLL